MHCCVRIRCYTAGEGWQVGWMDAGGRATTRRESARIYNSWAEAEDHMRASDNCGQDELGPFCWVEEWPGG